jgi:hypothetical protein
MTESSQTLEQPDADRDAAQSRTKDEFTLAQMMTVMDVASTLRKERITTQKQFNLDETKRELRARLLKTAEITGEKISEEEIDAAIGQYFDSLYEYREPTKGLAIRLAHLYVRRVAILKWTAVAVGVVLIVTTFVVGRRWLQASRLSGLIDDIRQQQKAMAAVAVDEDGSLARKVQALVAAADLDHKEGALGELKKTHAELAAMLEQLNSAYEVLVVAGQDRKSGIDRYFTDEEGQRASGYYLIVEAHDVNGNVQKMRIQNRETGDESVVAAWGERVPKEVYDRLGRDKQEDGALDERRFAVKHRGELEPEIVMPGTDGQPLQPRGRITSW